MRFQFDLLRIAQLFVRIIICAPKPKARMRKQFFAFLVAFKITFKYLRKHTDSLKQVSERLFPVHIYHKLYSL